MKAEIGCTVVANVTPSEHQADHPVHSNSGEGATAVMVRPAPSRDRRKGAKTLPPYNVILLDDDDHSHEYVIGMIKSIFGYPVERGMQLAKEVDSQGRAILLTTHREHAELKRDQIHSFGADELVATCAGSMTAIIEPAEGA